MLKASLFVCVPLLALSIVIGAEPDKNPIPEQLTEHVKYRFVSPRMVSQVRGAFRDLQTGEPAERRDATGFLVDLADARITKWLLVEPKFKQMTVLQSHLDC